MGKSKRGWRLRRAPVLLGSLLVVGLLGAGCGAPSGEKLSEVGQSQSAERGIDGMSGRPDSAQQSQIAEQPTGEQSQRGDARQVSHTAKITLRVENIAQATTKVRGLSRDAGGYLAEENSHRDHARLVVKAPADRLGQALEGLTGLGHVTERSQRAKDVTDQIVDTKSRIGSQRASVDRLRALMGEAETVGEIVSIEGELTERETELDALERRQASLAQQVELATVIVALHTAPDAHDQTDSTGFLTGIGNGWRALLDVANAVLTVMGSALPFLLAIGLPVGVLWMVLRRWWSHSRPSWSRSRG